MTLNEFADKFELSESKGNRDFCKSKSTGNCYFIENCNGYWRVYVNFDPSSKKIISGKPHRGEVYNLTPGQSAHDFIAEIDSK